MPAAADVDRARLEVDLVPAERHQLTAAQASVERGRPKRPVLLGHGGDQGRRLRRRGEPLPAAADARELESGRRVDVYLAAERRSLIDRPEGRGDDLDGGGSVPVGVEPVDEVLQVDAPDVVQAACAVRRVDAERERPPNRKRALRACTCRRRG
jgi:hypothetical protein